MKGLGRPQSHSGDPPVAMSSVVHEGEGLPSAYDASFETRRQLAKGIEWDCDRGNFTRVAAVSRRGTK